MKALFVTMKIALRALGRNKTRSALTALGVIIGVASVISMISIGNGAKAQMEAQVASLGKNVVMIYPLSSTSSSGLRLGYGSAISLTLEDAEAIEREIPGALAVSPELYAYTQVSAGNQNWKTKLYGEAPEYFAIRQWPAAEGELFTETDLRAAVQVAVVGQTAARQLFGEETPVGQVLLVGGVPFTVAGLLTKKGFDVKGHDQDDVVIIPYTSALQRFMGKHTGLYAIHVQADDDAALFEVREQIGNLLRDRHRITSAKDDDFVVRSQQEIVDTAIATTRTMTTLLGAIASISLVVGGVGIMNIMLVSVTERTREIGIRMAVGAHRRDILQQFLVEACTLSSIGGVVGIAAGIAASRALTALAHWPTLVSSGSVMIAFLVSAVAGIFFGFYPARRASRLDPIDALRYE